MKFTFTATLASLLCILCFTACGPSKKDAELKVPACDLISAADIQEIQGEAVAETKPSERKEGPLTFSQCYYRLPTFNKSVTLEVTHPTTGKSSEMAIDDFWTKRFLAKSDPEADERAAEMEKERERSGANTAVPVEAPTGPQRVPNVGDEAFWSGNQITGTLYVKKGGFVLAIGVGGPASQAEKIDKATKLASKALAKL